MTERRYRRRRIERTNQNFNKQIEKKGQRTPYDSVKNMSLSITFESLRTKHIPCPGYTGDPQNQHFSILIVFSRRADGQARE